MFKNWKTSIAGLGSIFTGVALIVKGNLTSGVAAVTTGIGLLFAKDSDVKEK